LGKGALSVLLSVVGLIFWNGGVKAGAGDSVSNNLINYNY
jgi:ATP adenylyltransferase/5',5'''-P-1,P-4-tetraphosphate phosphorylase II